MKRVLVAPLDWGLGHATRCIPVIRALQKRGCEVFLAGSGHSLRLLNAEFPDLPAYLLPGYDPEYPASGGSNMVWKMARQLPRFLRAIRAEHQALETWVSRQAIDAVISDNRYGCWSEKVPSAFITHQSNILMPRRFGWLARPVRAAARHFIHRYTVCWLPDFPGHRSIAGALLPDESREETSRFRLIGSLSRFTPRQGNTPRRYDLAAVFSGPEPQRTILEEIVLKQLSGSGLTYFVVRGLPGNNGATVKDHQADFLTSDALQEVIESADIVLARSGYSTIMDLAALGKKAIFIPTPGQTEQEYLAEQLHKKGIAFSVAQNRFNLNEALEQARQFSGFQRQQHDHDLLESAIDDLLNHC